MRNKILIFALLALLSACTKPVQDSLYCRLSLQATLSDGREAVSITIDPALPGNQLRNLNTGMNYSFPIFVNNLGQLQVQKGVYVISFDGDALFADGSHATVRFSAHSTPATAVNLMEDAQVLELKLIVLR
ncbi:MAG: hypothetical protein IJ753_08175 [Bacteroidales bacterium]|nr:hypothetical protein [Bacteroidales bacterium]